MYSSGYGMDIENEPDFIVFFNHRRQWFDVSMEFVTPETFQRHDGGRWAYFNPNHQHPRRGYFGDIHFVASRVRADVVSHELLHLLFEWINCKNGGLSSRNEEKWCLQYDELVRHFWKEYDKWKKTMK
jgi:hypothetical protein